MLRCVRAFQVTVGRALLLAGFLFLGSCAADRFAESDDGETRTVTQGTTFFVSLASTGKTPADEPRVEGSAVQFVSRGSEPGRDVYRFYALGVGEANIRIRVSLGESGALPEYVLRVKVDPGSRPPSSAPLQQKSAPY
jgi:hypothetical protein